MMSRNSLEYEDACIIGAYLMQSMIADGGPNARQAAKFMGRYAHLMSRALGTETAQVAADITDKYKKTYAGIKGFK